MTQREGQFLFLLLFAERMNGDTKIISNHEKTSRPFSLLKHDPHLFVMRRVFSPPIPFGRPWIPSWICCAVSRLAFTSREIRESRLTNWEEPWDDCTVHFTLNDYSFSFSVSHLPFHSRNLSSMFLLFLTNCFILAICLAFTLSSFDYVLSTK